jgi:hypothetical protein
LLFLAKLGDPKAMGCEREIADRLKELWGQNPGSIYNTPIGAVKGDDSEALEGIRLSLLGLGVREEFYAACQSIQIANGLLNRKLIIEEPDIPPDNYDPSTEAFPSVVFNGLMKLQNLKPAKLGWDSGAREIFEEAKAAVRREPNEMKQKLLSRGPEMRVRLAMGIACSRFSTVGISRNDMKLADEIVRRSGRFFQGGIEDAESKREMRHAELVRQIEVRVRDKFGGEASAAEIKRTFKNNKTHKNAVNDALEDMVDSGTFVMATRETGGRNKVVLRLK